MAWLDRNGSLENVRFSFVEGGQLSGVSRTCSKLPFPIQ